MDALPDDTRPIMERLLGYRLLTPQVLAAQVARHLDEFEAECALPALPQVGRRRPPRPPHRPRGADLRPLRRPGGM